MFNYPKQFENAVRPGNYPTRVEQSCVKCAEWFVVSPEAVKIAMDVWSKPGNPGWAMQSCACSLCGEKQILVMPGKYDAPRAKRREDCSVQFWSWAKPAKGVAA